MLRRLRVAPVARTAVLLAAVLSLSGSLGLHLEPAEGHGNHGGVGFAATTGPPTHDTASHVCLVCLLHFAVSLAPLAAVAPTVLPAATAVLAPWAPFHGSTQLRPHAGRAPPALF